MEDLNDLKYYDCVHRMSDDDNEFDRNVDPYVKRAGMKANLKEEAVGFNVDAEIIFSDNDELKSLDKSSDEDNGRKQTERYGEFNAKTYFGGP